VCSSSPARMNQAMASVEHGNYKIDPAMAPCSVYPPFVHMTGFTAKAADGSSPPEWRGPVYYNDNKLACQLQAKETHNQPLSSLAEGAAAQNWQFLTGFNCKDKHYTNNCCGDPPLPPCSKDSTSCWVNPFTCKDNGPPAVCCFS